MNKRHALASLILISWPLIVGLSLIALKGVAGAYPITVPAVVLVLTCVGLGLVVTAKVSMIRRGKLISFGTREMTPLNRRLYRLGYALMIGSWALAGVALAAMANRLI